ncbi:hypothetical protein NTGZN8_20001 [Candidatus Nitrotoga fabula]|uniref:Uncharacterized protein n=1 Tax=Candidatus Nitrotoga fabula TaxID=2182327 RepID=A0A916F8U1_9PROT|nr:hypothetical protein NTGZN8_20001 [Candidatus Nitrotoga fabula]
MNKTGLCMDTGLGLYFSHGIHNPKSGEIMQIFRIVTHASVR